MRFKHLTLPALAVLLLLCACDKEPQPVGGARKLFATLSVPAAKVMVWDNQLLWGAGESLWFWYNDGKDVFVRTEEDDANEGESLAVFNLPLETVAASSSYCMGAVAPAGAVLGDPADPARVTMLLPAEQHPVDGSFDPAAGLMLAEPVTVSSLPDPVRLELHPVVALNVISLKGMPQKVSAVEIQAPAGVALAGKRILDLKHAAAGDISESSHVLTLQYDTPVPSGDVALWFASWGVDARDLRVRVTGSSRHYTATLPGVTLREGRINELAMDCAEAAMSYIDPLNVPEADILEMVRTDVVNTAYYKDAFLDGGCNLNPGIKMDGEVMNGYIPPVLDFLKLTSEYFLSTEDDAFANYTAMDYDLQQDIIGGSNFDSNGVLLYPDGDPRFRMIYVFGGSSGRHGRSLGYTGRSRVQKFYDNGGCYVGSCAGAYLAGRFADGSVNDYFDIWDGGNMIHTGLSASSTGMKIVAGSPLLRYYDFGGDNYVEGVRHNGGGYMDENKAPKGTEILARFGTSPGGSTKEIYYNKVSTWAYKRSDRTGRLVVCGSHPEDAFGGEVRDYLAAMYRYALDGQGMAKVKGVLRNGVPREMRNTSLYQSANSPIGDLQCHHFVVYLPQATDKLSLKLEASPEYDMQLFLKKDSFAFPEASPDASSDTRLLETGRLEAGLYYVTVRCATTVTATLTVTNPLTYKGRRFAYSGKLGVLNGVPYTLTASWE